MKGEPGMLNRDCKKKDGTHENEESSVSVRSEHDIYTWEEKSIALHWFSHSFFWVVCGRLRLLHTSDSQKGGEQ